MKINPHLTTTGKHSKSITESILKDVLRYDISNGDNLGYEYKSDESRFIFITGKNEDERLISMFKPPIVDKDQRGKNVIIVDMREFVNIKNDFETLSEIILPKTGYELPLITALLTADYLEKDNFGDFKNFYYLSLQTVLINRLSYTLSLDNADVETISIVITSFLVNVVEGSKDNDVKDFIISNNLMGGKIEMSSVDDIQSKINRDANTIDELVKNIQLATSTNRLSSLSKDALLNIFSMSIFRTNVLQLFIGLESPIHWIALVYMYMTKNAYKKSALALVLDKFKRKLKTDDLIRDIDNIVKEHKV